ncbi:MAG: YraN family protein [Bacteroidota bacterium]
MQKNNRASGTNAESIAEEFLKTKGMKTVQKNFHFGRNGEIDLVMNDGETLVFVEVKARSSDAFGTPESAVTFKKQQTMRTTAQGYLYVKNIQNRECRFDVVAIVFKNGEPEIRHIPNAF